MLKLTFVIYGAGSDIIAPVFSHFTDADFICLVNRSKPGHLKGLILETGSDDFENELKGALADVGKDRMLIFLSAAVYQKDELFIAHSRDGIEQMIHVGITQALMVSQILLVEMVKRRKGRVINLSSFRANAPAKGAAVYAAIKSFGNTFFSALGLEYGRFDITSNSIAIGFAESKLLDRLESHKLAHFKKSVAKNKFLPQEEFLDTIEFIIKSKYFNASVIDLNGGLGFLE
jgi:3-oxoacyl-[acyl-carrier protein] reductase